MDIEPLEFQSDNVEIYHTQGHKDKYKVEIEVDQKTWSPTNEEIFALLHMWYTSEEAAYSSGYGKTMPWFYNTLCSLDREGYMEAKEANSKRGKKQLDYFEKLVSEYANDIINDIQDLKSECGVEKEKEKEDKENLFNY